MKVIINADDFGRSHEINVAIEDAIKIGAITSATIMANAPFFEEAIEIAKKYKEISFGVHLNLVSFKPLTNSQMFSKYHLLDESGEFVVGAVSGLKELPEELKLSIKEEWLAQIRKVVDTGLNVSHIDSHQHTHSITALKEILLDVIQECHIERVRQCLHFTVYALLRNKIKKIEGPKYEGAAAKIGSKRKSLPSRLLNHLFVYPHNYRCWNRYIKMFAFVPDDIMNYQSFINDQKYQMKRMKTKVLELECHPGLVPNSIETDMLMKLSIKGLDIEMVSYWDLTNSGIIYKGCHE